MTYCVAMRLDAGLVFLSDARTNAGVDQISTFRKMTVFENPGERMMVLMSAGNLAITQAVRQVVCERTGPSERSVWSADSLVEAARLVGDAVREVFARDGAALKHAGIEFNCSFLFGGQVRGERMRLFHVYAAGNFIEATPENPYFQIGESKYGKPIIDRVINPGTPLDEAAKCALISMDSTLRSNISVGLPLDLLVYEVDRLAVTKFVQIDQNNEYMNMIRRTWGARLKQVFQELPDPTWRDANAAPGAPLLETDPTYPVRAPVPASVGPSQRAPVTPVQLVASAPQGRPEAQQGG
jgi:putative proteasome-type protease